MSLPIFGAPLGHQSIAQAFGGEIVRAKNMMHGKTSQIERIKDNEIFEEIPPQFRATRYPLSCTHRDRVPKGVEV